MPELEFKVTGVKPAARSMTPLLQFQLEVENHPADETIHAVLLQAQIQIQSPGRSYTPNEKEKLGELFGTPKHWGQIPRGRLWASTNTIVGGFHGSTRAALTVPCTYDLTFSTVKYLYALEQGEVPFLFLFSGTVFYASPNCRWQVRQISWDRECSYRMPVEVWQDLIESHYPRSAWLYLDRDVFDQLYAFRRRHGWSSWEQTIQHMLADIENIETADAFV